MFLTELRNVQIMSWAGSLNRENSICLKEYHYSTNNVIMLYHTVRSKDENGKFKADIYH